MSMHRLILLVLGAAVAGLGNFSTAAAITTAPPDSQVWDFEPDAWGRGNTADTSYFGWDVLEGSGAPLGFGRVLDDTTPDLGAGPTATGTRYYQGVNGAADYSPTTYGHRSTSGNYYSGFGPSDVAYNTITGVAPASGAGGFTTVVLQMIGGAPSAMGPNTLDDLSFTMQDAGWTLQKHLYGATANGTGLHWVEWTAPGAMASFAIDIRSATSSKSIDAVQIDTHWSPNAPVINARTAIGVPEPSAAALAAVCIATLVRRRRDG